MRVIGRITSISPPRFPVILNFQNYVSNRKIIPNVILIWFPKKTNLQGLLIEPKIFFLKSWSEVKGRDPLKVYYPYASTIRDLNCEMVPLSPSSLLYSCHIFSVETAVIFRLFRIIGRKYTKRTEVRGLLTFEHFILFYLDKAWSTY